MYRHMYVHVTLYLYLLCVLHTYNGHLYDTMLAYCTCDCWKDDGLGQFFGSNFDQLMWRRAYLGSDIQLLG